MTQRTAAVTGCGQEPDGRVETESTCGQEPDRGAEPAACGQGAEAASCANDHYLDPREMRTWRAFLAASTHVTNRLNQELVAGAGISMHEYEILVRLSEAPERRMRMSTLADNVAYSRSRLTHTVGRLEKEGYVLREACADDRRGVLCLLTQAGLDFLRQAAPIHLAGVRRHVIDPLDSDQRDALTTILETLVKAPNHL